MPVQTQGDWINQKAAVSVVLAIIFGLIGLVLGGLGGLIIFGIIGYVLGLAFMFIMMRNTHFE
jgi:hypothetical protein